jgi:hypothetical protein
LEGITAIDRQPRQPQAHVYDQFFGCLLEAIFDTAVFDRGIATAREETGKSSAVEGGVLINLARDVVVARLPSVVPNGSDTVPVDV